MKNIVALLLLALPLLARGEEKGEFYVAAGRFSPASNSQLANPSGQFGFVLGGGGRFSPHFAWDLDLLFAEQRVDTPSAFGRPGFLVSQSGRSTIETWGLGGILKGILPFEWADLYAGGGVGFYKSTFTVPRTSLLFSNQDLKRSDSAPGVQLVAGADLKLGRSWRLGFQWRWLELSAQFGTEVPGEVKVGGNFGLLHSRWVF